MNRLTACVLVVLSLVLLHPGSMAAQLRKQTAPDNLTRRGTWRDWRFWTATGLAVAFMVADVELSHSCFSRYRGCGEANPLLFSRRPSRLRMYGLGGLYAAPVLAGSYWVRRTQRADEGGLWFVPLAGTYVLHGAAIGITASTIHRFDAVCPAAGGGCARPTGYR